MKDKIIFSFCLTLLAFTLQAQKTVISGKVTEITSGSPVPFANIVITGTTKGTTTDFDGIYHLVYDGGIESLTVSYIGFKTKVKQLNGGGEQLVNFQLEEDILSLDDVIVYAGENPAFPIMRSVIDNKKRNDKRSLDAYQYEAYTKIEVDVNHITQKFRDRKFIKKITSVLDSIEQIAGDDGLPILPIFISEAVSNYFYKKDPRQTYENIRRTKVSGVGIEDGSLTSQVIGSTFQEYNFYQNWLNIFNKEFASPLANGWKSIYEYDLIDSLDVDGHYCYRLDFWPKRAQELAFRGTMWITKEGFALKRIDAQVEQSANLNFIEKLKVQQDNIQTVDGPWLPQKSRVLVDIGELNEKSAGLLAKFYVSLKDITVNNPKPDKFYEIPIVMEEDVRKKDDSYWDDKRHEPLTPIELSVYRMIDTLKTIPVVKTYTDIIQTLGTGFFSVGKFDLGPYWLLFAFDDVEGIRPGLGFRSNINFSNKWILSGDLGYGLKDQEFKYRGEAEYIVSRRPWTTIGFQHIKELDPVWVLNEDDFNGAVFIGFARWGDLIQPFRHHETTLKFQTTPFKGLTQKVNIKHQIFNPLAKTPFSYRLDPGNTDSELGTEFRTTEINFETRISKDELFVINDNKRSSLGPVNWPIIKLKYTLGLSGVLDSDFNYHKVELGVTKKLAAGVFGRSKIDIKAGYIFSQLPYPLLKVHTGNEFPFYFDFTFNQMDFFEFTSDRYVEFRYSHRFEGSILNRIPLMKKLKWRLVGSVNMIMGGVRDENKLDINPLVTNEDGTESLPFSSFEGAEPYIELGYGVENIFKFFRIDAFHRLTYLDRPNVRDFGLKFSFQFIL